jgi:hypothetical protein
VSVAWPQEVKTKAKQSAITQIRHESGRIEFLVMDLDLSCLGDAFGVPAASIVDGASRTQSRPGLLEPFLSSVAYRWVNGPVVAGRIAGGGIEIVVIGEVELRGHVSGRVEIDLVEQGIGCPGAGESSAGLGDAPEALIVFA